MTMRIWIAVLLVVGLAVVIASRRVQADTTCPVTASVPDGKGGSVVTFNCGVEVLTIHEPVWP
jgi:hypothetical protein